MSRLNCPHCDFHFKALLVNDDQLPALAPIVCESCGEVSLLENRTVRRLQPAELEDLKGAPVWRDFIEPALAAINAQRGKRS